jgi:hypothetical protein
MVGRAQTCAATTTSGICSSPRPTIMAASKRTGVEPADTAAAALLDPSHTAVGGGSRRTARVTRWAAAADPALGKTLETWSEKGDQESASRPKQKCTGLIHHAEEDISKQVTKACKDQRAHIYMLVCQCTHQEYAHEDTFMQKKTLTMHTQKCRRDPVPIISTRHGRLLASLRWRNVDDSYRCHHSPDAAAVQFHCQCHVPWPCLVPGRSPPR